MMDSNTSIYEYSSFFRKAVPRIEANPERVITLDGGPHTYWWPLQAPDGSPPPKSLIPPNQIIRELIPNAKFLITLANPVNRMYSDYYFLNDDRRVAEKSSRKSGLRGRDIKADEKSPELFHERAEKQIREFHLCVAKHMNSSEYLEDVLGVSGESDAVILKFLHSQQYSNPSDAANSTMDNRMKEAVVGRWFRSAQICAHDRHRFGVAGWGRLAIGLYSLYYEKWLEHFPPSQFKFVRLEDYDENPREYLKDVFAFLQVDMPVDGDEWGRIIGPPVKNKHHDSRPPMLAKTKEMLQQFYLPFNILLAKALRDSRFIWSDEELESPEEATKEVQNEHPEVDSKKVDSGA